MRMLVPRASTFLQTSYTNEYHTSISYAFCHSGQSAVVFTHSGIMIHSKNIKFTVTWLKFQDVGQEVGH